MVCILYSSGLTEVFTGSIFPLGLEVEVFMLDSEISEKCIVKFFRDLMIYEKKNINYKCR